MVYEKTFKSALLLKLEEHMEHVQYIFEELTIIADGMTCVRQRKVAQKTYTIICISPLVIDVIGCLQ
jgi:hypothetical protein